MSFVSVDITTDPDLLLDSGVDAINATLATNGLPGWTASDATLAVLVLSACAQLIADGTLVAATLLPAVFRAFGTQLFGIPYNNGAQASVLSTWTFTSPAPSGGYFIAGGTAVIIDGYVFYTQSPYTSGVGDTTASIMLVASQAGVLYNDLGGVNATAQLNDGIDFVATVVTVGVTSGGADQQTDADYQNQLVGTLQLQAPRPLVATDFAGMVLSDLASQATGVVVGRATAIDGYYPDGRILSTGGATSTALSCTTASGSPTVTLASPSGNQVPTPGTSVSGTGVPSTSFVGPTVTESTFTLVNGLGVAVNATASATNSLTFGGLSGYGPVHLTCTGTTTNTSPTISAVTAPYPGAIPDVGARVTGTAIPAGTTVLASPAPTTTGFTLSANATGSHTAETITVSSWTTVQAANCAFVTDDNGNALSAASMDALATWLAGFRPQNWLTNVVAPSYTLIYVTCEIHVLPTADPTATAAAVQQALLTYVNPQTWGNTFTTTAQGWLNSTSGFNVVRLNKLINVVESVSGVDYIPPGTITLGTSPSPAGTSDVTLTGPAPLPLSTTTSIPLPTVV